MAMAKASAVREKFSSQAAPEVPAALRQIAENQGRQFQAVLDEALRDYIGPPEKDAVVAAQQRWLIASL